MKAICSLNQGSAVVARLDGHDAVARAAARARRPVRTAIMAWLRAFLLASRPHSCVTDTPSRPRTLGLLVPTGRQ